MSLSFKALAAQPFALYYSTTTRVICNRHALAHKCLSSHSKRLTQFNPDRINSQPLIISLQLVGLGVDSCSSVFESLIAINSFGFWWRNTYSGSRARIWFTVLNSPFECGMEINAWRSFEVTDLNSLKLMVPMPSCCCPLFAPLIHLDIMINRVSPFLASNQIVFLMPSHWKINTSFSGFHFASFFLASSAIWNPPRHPHLLVRHHELFYTCLNCYCGVGIVR